MIILGQCDGSNLHPAFRKLTKATSGQDLPIKDPSELRKLNGLVEGALEGEAVVSTGSTIATKKKRSVGPPADSRYRIPVDDSIEKIFVLVTTMTQRTGLCSLGIPLRFIAFNSNSTTIYLLSYIFPVQ